MFGKSHKILLLLMLFALVVLYVKYETIQSSLFARLSQKGVEPKSNITIATPVPVIGRSYPLQPDGTFKLPDVQANEAELAYRSETNIFFIISTIFEGSLATLTARQSCAIESAARSNPDWKVFVLFISASGFSFGNSSYFAPLLPFSNVYLRRVDLQTFGIGTPLEDFLAVGSLNNSSFIVEHTSDLLRLLTVFKYGGTYLDTDVVVMRSLSHLPRNYLVSEGDGYVANGIINLQATGFGHALAGAFLREAARTFNGSQWAANGPFLVTRILRQLCYVQEPARMVRNQCGSHFEVLPPNEFFQVFYPHQNWFFEEQHTGEVLAKVHGRTLTHLWNKLTSEIKLRKNSTAAYVQLAKRYCPNVLWSCGEYF